MKENPIRSAPGIPYLLGVLVVAAMSVWLLVSGIGGDPAKSLDQHPSPGSWGAS